MMKLVVGKEQDFWEFVDGIGEEDKVGVISHTDLDGLSSAIFLEEILKVKNIDVQEFYFIGYGKGMFDSFFEKFKEKGITKVFLTDMSADNGDFEGFNVLRERFDCFLIDHHPVHESLKDFKWILKSPSPDCSAWVLYNFLKKVKNIDSWNWLVLATMITEFSFNSEENFEFIKSKCQDINSKEDIFNSEHKRIADVIGSALTYYGPDELRKVYTLVKKKNLVELEKVHKIIDSALQRDVKKYFEVAEFYPEKNVYVGYFDLEYHRPSHLTTVASMKEPEKTFVFAYDSSSKEGFIKISSRNQAGVVNVSEMLKFATKNLKDFSAGGHAKAAGAVILKSDLAKFKEQLLDYLGK